MHDPLSSSLEHGRARYHLSTLSLPFLSLINLISHVLLALKSNRIAAAAAAVTATHRSAMLGDYESIEKVCGYDFSIFCAVLKCIL